MDEPANARFQGYYKEGNKDTLQDASSSSTLSFSLKNFVIRLMRINSLIADLPYKGFSFF